jgi:hypothetical protein
VSPHSYRTRAVGSTSFRDRGPKPSSVVLGPEEERRENRMSRKEKREEEYVKKREEEDVKKREKEDVKTERMGNERM